MRRAKYFGNPVVLTAHIPKEIVAFYTDERHEKEVVVFDSPMSIIDGNNDDWRVRFNVQDRVIQERNKSYYLSSNETK